MPVNTDCCNGATTPNCNCNRCGCCYDTANARLRGTCTITSNFWRNFENPDTDPPHHTVVVELAFDLYIQNLDGDCARFQNVRDATPAWLLSGGPGGQIVVPGGTVTILSATEDGVAMSGADDPSNMLYAVSFSRACGGWISGVSVGFWKKNDLNQDIFPTIGTSTPFTADDDCFNGSGSDTSVGGGNIGDTGSEYFTVRNAAEWDFTIDNNFCCRDGAEGGCQPGIPGDDGGCTGCKFCDPCCFNFASTLDLTWDANLPGGANPTYLGSGSVTLAYDGNCRFKLADGDKTYLYDAITKEVFITNSDGDFGYQLHAAVDGDCCGVDAAGTVDWDATVDGDPDFTTSGGSVQIVINSTSCCNNGDPDNPCASGAALCSGECEGIGDG